MPLLILLCDVVLLYFIFLSRSCEMFKFEFESKEFDFIKYLKNEKKHFLFPLALGWIHFLSPSLAQPALHRFFLTGPAGLPIVRHPACPGPLCWPISHSQSDRNRPGQTVRRV
jgi:hypothetical protein